MTTASKTLARCAKPVTVTWSKGDDLPKIAKKYKLKSWKRIWNHPDNRAIVKKRKKPEQFQPGDVLVIPPDEKEQQRLQQVMARFDQAMSQTDGYIRLQEKKIADLEKQIAQFYKIVDQHTRRQFDGAESRKFVALALGVTASLESMLDTAAEMPSLFGKVNVRSPGLTTIVNRLYAYHRSMKGGVYDDKILAEMKHQIKKAESEIATLKKRIQDADKGLQDEATKALHDFCKVKTLEPTVVQVLKSLQR